MKYVLFLGLVCNIFLFDSCTKYEPAPPAFFIKPSLVSVAATAAQRTSNSKISDLYIYVNGQFQGAFQAGNLMPIVTNGNKVNIDVFAGIKNNGIKETSITWIFYQDINFDTLVESGKTIDRHFTFKYNPNTHFEWLENFENIPLSSTGTIIKSAVAQYYSTTLARAVLSDCCEGVGSIVFSETGGSGYGGRVESIMYDTLPIGNTNLYLELNYKCDQVFEVGLNDGVNGDKSALNINPSATWNKIYIQLADAASRAVTSNPNLYKIYFNVVGTNDNPNPHVWLDNIKLIYL